MATTDAPATLSELRTFFLTALKEVTGVTAVNTAADAYLNSALQDIHQERWSWAERRRTFRTHVPYSTGTVSVAITNLTTRGTVTGTSTAWTTTNSYGEANAQALFKMTLGSEMAVHIVSVVNGATSITLDGTTPYVGSAALDNGSYDLYQDEYSLPSDFDDIVDARYFDEDRRIQLIGAQEFNIRFARNTHHGGPRYATIIEMGPSGSVALRPIFVLGPSPDQSYIIPFRYYTTNLAISSTGVVAANMNAAGDEPIVPRRYRNNIVWKALELWFASRQKNAQLSADFAARYTTGMLRARQAHSPAQDTARIVPDVGEYQRAAKRPYTGRSSTRFGGQEWDELRI